MTTEEEHHERTRWQKWKDRLLGDPELYNYSSICIPSCPWRKTERKLTFYTKGEHAVVLTGPVTQQIVRVRCWGAVQCHQEKVDISIQGVVHHLSRAVRVTTLTTKLLTSS